MCLFFQASDKKADTDIFRKFPRKASILNMPIITTLYYSCFYHYGESEVQAHIYKYKNVYKIVL